MPVTAQHDRLSTFRMPTALIQHAREVARYQGMGLSSFVRQAIRRNIDAYLLNERKTLTEFR